MAKFSTETMENGGEWDNISKVLKGKKLSAQILKSEKISFQE